MVHALILAAVLMAPVVPQAGPPRADRPLPAFQVTSPDGTPAASTRLSSESQWLLVYVNPASATSRRLLNAMKEWEAPQLVTRTVLIIQGNPAEARAFIEKSLPEELRGMLWYADGDRSAWQALKLTGSPVLVGVANGQKRMVAQWCAGGSVSTEIGGLTWVRY